MSRLSVRGMCPDLSKEAEFSDSFAFSDDDTPLPTALSICPTNSPAVRLPESPNSHQFGSFNEILSHITHFLDALKQNGRPSETLGIATIIPEPLIPEGLGSLVLQYSEHREKDELLSSIIGWDRSEFPDTVLAQLDLLASLRDTSLDLAKYVECRLDSRVAALLHFVLSRGRPLEEAVYHTVRALEYFVKFPTLAPIACFFPGFSLDALIVNLCRDLASLYAKHPLLPSVIDNFAVYNPSVSACLPATAVEDEPESSSDEFFRSIQRMDAAPVLLIDCLAPARLVNPLDDAAPGALIERVTLSAPPTTVTYAIDNEILTPAQFEQWIGALRLERMDVIQVRSAMKVRSGPNSPYSSDPQYPIQPGGRASAAADNPESFLAMIARWPSLRGLRDQVPEAIAPSNYALYLPVLHTVNCTSDTLEHAGALYIKLLTMEREAHLALKGGSLDRADRALQYFESQVPTDWTLAEVGALAVKREQPPRIADLPSCSVAAQAAVDYELLITGRSPLSLAPFAASVPGGGDRHPLANKSWRARFLFTACAQNVFPPYLAFRIAFALAANLGDSERSLACRFLFEGLYVFLRAVPAARTLPCVRAAMLFFARLLDSVRKYSCAAAVFDSFFVLDPSSSASIATVALANGDLIRGVFHYHQALRHLIAQGSVDEVLYLAQALVGIYVGRWHLSPAMSVLTYILRATYSLAVDLKRERMDCCASGSLKLPRAVVKPPEFTPDPAAAASILTGIALVAVFGKLGLFTAAATLLVKLQSATDNTAILRVLTYLQLWLAHRQNDAARLSQLAISIDVRRASAAVNSEFKVVNRVNFDPDLAALRLLARSCIDRGHPALGLFWAEMFIQSHQAARANELGKGFALRGAALLALLDHLPAGLSHVDVPDAVGRWTTATDPSKEQIFAQAIASLTLACAYFSRVGKTYPFWRTRLMLLDAAMDRPLDRLPAIAMFAQCATAGRTDFPSHDAPNVSQIAKDAVVAMARLMHPILLMFAQVCACRAEITAGNRDNAKTYFDFASGNFIRLFVAGPKFLGTELSLKNLTLVDRFLRRLCEEALELGPAVTNDKLDLFDVMNDVSCLITDRRRTVRRDDVVLIVPSLDLHVSVLDFERGEPRTFGEILSAGGFLDKSLGHGPPTISDLVASIACNNRLADNQKLSEDDMTTMNYQFCRQIESRAEAIRRDRSAQIPPESSFAYLARSCPMAVNTIFIQRLLGRIAVYVPSTGNVRYVPVEPADEWGTVSVPIHRPECTFRTGSQLFAASFAEYVAELIHFEGAAAKARVRLGTLPVDLFGDLLNQCAPTQTDTIRIAGQFDSFIRVKADQPPIVFITSVDLGPVPFEVLFPNRVIVRAPSYSSLVFRLAKSPSRPIPTPVVLRHPLDSFKAACGRVVDIVGYVMHDLCDGPPISGAGSGERYSPLATILFKSGTTEAVQKRWQFARIIEHAPQWSEFFIFSFADLAEMSPVIRRVFSEFPSAFCMFIPGAYMKEAFRIIGKVYQMSPPPTRHRKSATLLPPREVLFESMYQFIVSLQRMLMRILKIPVPLFVHL